MLCVHIHYLCSVCFKIISHTYAGENFFFKFEIKIMIFNRSLNNDHPWRASQNCDSWTRKPTSAINLLRQQAHTCWSVRAARVDSLSSPPSVPVSVVLNFTGPPTLMNCGFISSDVMADSSAKPFRAVVVTNRYVAARANIVWADTSFGCDTVIDCHWRDYPAWRQAVELIVPSRQWTCRPIFGWTWPLSSIPSDSSLFGRSPRSVKTTPRVVASQGDPDAGWMEWLERRDSLVC